MKNLLRLLVLFCLFTTALSAASKRDTSLYAVYLTWKESPETTMVVQWVTGNGDRNDEVDYHKWGDSDWVRMEGRHKSMPEDQPYMIHRNELTGLSPNTIYEFRVGERDEIHRFRTMPSKLSEPIRFVVGGDMYHDGLAILRETNRRAASTNPSFALVGGDIAYAASGVAGFLPDFVSGWFDGWLGQNSKRWMEWLIAWSQDMVTQEGLIIPMIPVLGNHDVNGRFGQSPDEAPFFYTLFAFPGRQGYGVLDFGRYMSILAMDSGHTHSVGGKQTDWLEEMLAARRNVPWKFALYHVPAYPSVRKVDAKMVPQIRGHWVPLFEEYGLTAAFENHDHAYKRTHRLRDGAIDPNGVLYVGDGAWGIAKPRQPKTPDERWYLACTAAVRHFILVTLGPEKMQIQAIASENGAVIDSTQLSR